MPDIPWLTWLPASLGGRLHWAGRSSSLSWEVVFTELDRQENWAGLTGKLGTDKIVCTLSNQDVFSVFATLLSVLRGEVREATTRWDLQRCLLIAEWESSLFHYVCLERKSSYPFLERKHREKWEVLYPPADWLHPHMDGASPHTVEASPNSDKDWSWSLYFFSQMFAYS